MSTARAFASSFKKKISSFTLTTPSAIIIAAVILGGSHIVYGMVAGTGKVKAPVDLVKIVAKEFNLKGSAWEECIASPYVSAQIQAEFNDGVQAGVTGTPTSFVLVKKETGYETVARIEGAQTESYLKAALDEALSGKAQTTPFAGSPISPTEFVDGNRSNVIILEYADIECPFCISFHPTLTKVLAEYKDRVGYAYRHFPLTTIHPNAERYAAATECAGNLKGKDAYFGFINSLYAKMGSN